MSEPTWTGELREAAQGKSRTGVERALAEPPLLLAPDLVRALVSALMASLVVAAAVLRTRMTADLPFDLLALLLRTAAAAFVVRALITAGFVVERRLTYAKRGGKALAWSADGLLEITRAGERFLPRREVLDVRVREEPGRVTPSERATFVVAMPRGALSFWALSGRYAETADILHARLSRWLKDEAAPESEPPAPRDEDPEARYRRAAEGKPDAGDIAVPEGRGYMLRAPYAALLGLVFAVDTWLGAGPMRQKVLPVALLGCALSIGFVLAWLFWMGRRRATRLGIALLITPEEVLVRDKGGVVSVPFAQLASIEVVPRLAFSPFFGSFTARTLVLTARDETRLRFDAGFLGVPAEVLAATLEAYRVGRVQAAS